MALERRFPSVKRGFRGSIQARQPLAQAFDLGIAAIADAPVLGVQKAH
ncbi:hypothetical protein C4K19_2749 [Pseudomonas chlororaphis subsp. aurantiaca]|nr:hypothetical protein C4K19_2749 [Pseudomonas chlororaphis subsp. aurantiaca]AZD60603.1 hypothetical protein C4K18_2630 [Pseudomonas chlororaphis subsp. aurantiaca]